MFVSTFEIQSHVFIFTFTCLLILSYIQECQDFYILIHEMECLTDNIYAACDGYTTMSFRQYELKLLDCY